MIFLSDKFLNWLEEFTPHLIAAAVIFLLGILLDKLVLKVMHKGLSMRRTDVTIHKFLTSVVHTVLLIIIILSVQQVLLSVLLFKTVFQTSQAALSYFFQSLLNAVIM